jgi:hypothetical protein
MPVANRSSANSHVDALSPALVCEQSVLCSTSSVFLVMTMAVGTNFNFLSQADISIIAIYSSV